eukprot:2436191-Rhodomonas_salina.2
MPGTDVECGASSKEAAPSLLETPMEIVYKNNAYQVPYMLRPRYGIRYLLCSRYDRPGTDGACALLPGEHEGPDFGAAAPQRSVAGPISCAPSSTALMYCSGTDLVLSSVLHCGTSLYLPIWC